MNKSSFVSIYFTSGKVVIVKLNASKKKVEVFAVVDLPQGIIKEHTVQDVKSLSEILKRIWQKLKIREKTVGIVIPEFSTFTKSINLPKLETSEIDEAIKWQSEEYIPLDPKETLLDWKTINETPEEYKILLVAVNQSLINGYVNAVDNAGLFPLVVETPSMSLVRLAGENNTVKMVVYFSYDEIIITLSEGEEILVSSVIGVASSSQTLVSTIARILRHFDEKPISKIFIGGMPYNNSFVSDISKSFKVPLEKLQFKIAGVNEGDFQKIAIPLAMQFKDPSEPISTKTINLLPPEIISKYKGKRLHLQLWGLMLIVTFILVGCLMALSGTYFYLIQGLSKYKDFNSFSDVSYQKSKTASDEIKKVNTFADKTLKISSVNIYPQEILNLINEKKPENIIILRYKIDLEKGMIDISGLAAGRDDLYDFKKKIEEGGQFQKVVLPLTSFEQGENIEFKMSFIYTKLTPTAKTNK